jgi:nucleotide-binding universal stress UspA family protein
MKTILYATDYSKNSAAALKLSYWLSKKLDAKLVILHVFDLNVALLTPLSLTYSKMEKETYSKHLEKLSVFCDSATGILPDGERMQIVIKENAIVYEGILETQKEMGADLVVMGMKGSSTLKELIIGSTTIAMIEKSPCPILAVPSSTNEIALKTITYTTDFEESDLHAIAWLVKNFISKLNATLNIVHISTKNEYAGEDQMEWFKEMLQQKVSFDKLDFKICFSDDIFKELVLFLSKTKTDLVVMLEREKTSFIKSLAHRDLVKQMGFKGTLPLLCFNKEMLSP